MRLRTIECMALAVLRQIQPAWLERSRAAKRDGGGQKRLQRPCPQSGLYDDIVA